jgi:hypothetical protein
MNARNLTGLKICRWKHRPGSIPGSGTSIHAGSRLNAVFTHSIRSATISASFAPVVPQRLLTAQPTPLPAAQQ